ncbi:MAG TPA: hypothetical protein VGO81_13610 [Solirubrobacteraceae bacterium]|nr:hypothetical protein [Solirubrobacteraceae bacterium]
MPRTFVTIGLIAGVWAVDQARAGRLLARHRLLGLNKGVVQEQLT